jgi:hypothetical protein
MPTEIDREVDADPRSMRRDSGPRHNLRALAERTRALSAPPARSSTSTQTRRATPEDPCNSSGFAHLTPTVSERSHAGPSATNAASRPEVPDAKPSAASAIVFTRSDPPTRSTAMARRSWKAVASGSAVALVGIAVAMAMVARAARPPPRAAGNAAEVPPTEAAASRAAEPDQDATAGAMNGSGNPTPIAADPATEEPLPAAARGPTSAKSGVERDRSTSKREAPRAAAGRPENLAAAIAQAVATSHAESAPPAKASPDEPKEHAVSPQSAPTMAAMEQPAMGAVQAAVGAVMPSAKGCVAAADDISRAQIVFGSSGAVTTVSVTGWAATNGATGCVRAALKQAKVAPFSKPSFTVGVTIRP